MRHPIRFAVLAAAWLPAAAGAETWRAIAIDDTTAHGAAVAYADTDSLSRTGDEVDFDYQVRFSSPPLDFDRLAGRMRIQCGARLWGSEHSAHYLGERRGSEFPAVELQPVRPNTNGSVIVDNICSGRFVSGPVDPAAHARAVFGAK
jgi:hypothetical protein